MIGWLKNQIDGLIGEEKKKKDLSRYVKTISINDIDIPTYVSTIKAEDVRNRVKEFVKTYKSLGYASATENSELRTKEWSSIELAIMFLFLRKNLDMLIPEPEKVFPKYIIGKDKQALKREVDILMQRYKQHVKADAKEEILREDKNWNADGIGHLLYYLNIYDS